MDDQAPSGDTIEAPEPELTDAAQILFGGPETDQEDGDQASESDKDPDAATDEVETQGIPEGEEGESQESDPGTEEAPREFDKSMYGLEVPLGDELGKVTIGELKDSYQRQQQTLSEVESQQSENQSQSYELIQARNELAKMVELIGPSANPALIAKIENDRQATVSRETLLMLKARPEWRDNARYEADRVALEGFVKQFGVGQNEFRSVTDHRIILMVDQARKDRAALDDAKAQLSKVRQPKPLPKTDKSQRGRNGRFAGKAKAKPSGREGQTSAVADILSQAGIIKD